MPKQRIIIWPFLFYNMLSTTPRMDEKLQALATEWTTGFSCTRYQNPSLYQTLNIFPETKHLFLLRNSFFSRCVHDFSETMKLLETG